MHKSFDKIEEGPHLRSYLHQHMDTIRSTAMRVNALKAFTNLEVCDVRTPEIVLSGENVLRPRWRRTVDGR